MKYGFFSGDKMVTFTHAKTLEEAVPYFIKHAIQLCEGIKIEPGKLLEAIQTFVNEYSEVVLENQMNDHGHIEYPIISLDEIADHIMNQGFLMVNRKNHDNRKVAKLVLDYMNKKNIQEYDSKSYIKRLVLNESF